MALFVFESLGIRVCVCLYSVRRLVGLAVSACALCRGCLYSIRRVVSCVCTLGFVMQSCVCLVHTRLVNLCCVCFGAGLFGVVLCMSTCLSGFS